MAALRFQDRGQSMDILVSFDRNYIGPFRTMLKSLAVSHPGESVHVWLLHSAIPWGGLDALEQYCAALSAELTPIQISRDVFQGAPVSKQYPQEMYYRLLAPQLLPASLERVLYLDPDILVINPLSALWELDLGEHIFAAASHSGVLELIDDVNRIRLDTEHDYYNTGVVLMDLAKARKAVRSEDIFAYVREHSSGLLLPDQDVFNALYGKYTLPVEDRIWNYDARYFHAYFLKSEGLCDMDWVMGNTAVLHFCGKRKPWKPSYTRRFGALYKHYRNLAMRVEG